MLFLCSTLFAIQILRIKQITNRIQYLPKIWKKKIPMNYEILFNPSTLMFETKIQKIPKVQMEHFQILIVDPNI